MKDMQTEILMEDIRAATADNPSIATDMLTAIMEAYTTEDVAAIARDIVPHREPDKACGWCERLLPATAYDLIGGSNEGRRGTCKDCRSVYNYMLHRLGDSLYCPATARHIAVADVAELICHSQLHLKGNRHE